MPTPTPFASSPSSSSSSSSGGSMNASPRPSQRSSRSSVTEERSLTPIDILQRRGGLDLRPDGSALLVLPGEVGWKQRLTIGGKLIEMETLAAPPGVPSRLSVFKTHNGVEIEQRVTIDTPPTDGATGDRTEEQDVDTWLGRSHRTGGADAVTRYNRELADAWTKDQTKKFAREHQDKVPEANKWLEIVDGYVAKRGGHIRANPAHYIASELSLNHHRGATKRQSRHFVEKAMAHADVTTGTTEEFKKEFSEMWSRMNTDEATNPPEAIPDSEAPGSSLSSDPALVHFKKLGEEWLGKRPESRVKRCEETIKWVRELLKHDDMRVHDLETDADYIDKLVTLGSVLTVNRERNRTKSAKNLQDKINTFATDTGKSHLDIDTVRTMRTSVKTDRTDTGVTLDELIDCLSKLPWGHARRTTETELRSSGAGIGQSETTRNTGIQQDKQSGDSIGWGTAFKHPFDFARSQLSRSKGKSAAVTDPWEFLGPTQQSQKPGKKVTFDGIREAR